MSELTDLGFRLRYAFEQASRAMAEFNAVVQEQHAADRRRWERQRQQRTARKARSDLDYAVWKETNGHVDV